MKLKFSLIFYFLSNFPALMLIRLGSVRGKRGHDIVNEYMLFCSGREGEGRKWLAAL